MILVEKNYFEAIKDFISITLNWRRKIVRRQAKSGVKGAWVGKY